MENPKIGKSHAVHSCQHVFFVGSSLCCVNANVREVLPTFAKKNANSACWCGCTHSTILLLMGHHPWFKKMSHLILQVHLTRNIFSELLWSGRSDIHATKGHIHAHESHLFHEPCVCHVSHTWNEKTPSHNMARAKVPNSSRWIWTLCKISSPHFVTLLSRRDCKLQPLGYSPCTKVNNVPLQLFLRRFQCTSAHQQQHCDWRRHARNSHAYCWNNRNRNGHNTHDILWTAPLAFLGSVQWQLHLALEQIHDHCGTRLHRCPRQDG